ncbi:MAG TPA: hypothetical protein VKO18_13565 [Terriglobia bacterium]|nr:hypothetical protein [Terriglobia bacterium]
MNEILEALQGVVLTEPDPEFQPDPAQPDDAAIETQLTQGISVLWSDHLRLSANHKTTAKELRKIRAALAERLYAVKNLLARPGRGGEWRGWLRERGIPRSSADRLVARYAETLGSDNENVLSGAISNSLQDISEKAAKDVWQRYRKVLVTEESVIQFIACVAEISGVHHERCPDGLLIFNPVPKAVEELPGSGPATGPAPQLSGEVPNITAEPGDESATTPTEPGLVVAATETDSEVAA